MAAEKFVTVSVCSTLRRNGSLGSIIFEYLVRDIAVGRRSSDTASRFVTFIRDENRAADFRLLAVY